MKNIRNFCIIAHIDHGKSTLADRLLQTTNTISEREMMDQVLDDMDLEREKGITIKSHAIQINMEGGMVEETRDQIIELVGCKSEDILLASARTGVGVDEILKAIVDRIPAPTGDPKAPLQALIFDSVFNSFRGIIVYYRILNGS